MILGVVTLLLIVGVTIWYVGFKKTQRSAFRGGVVLVATGLVSSLVLPFCLVGDPQMPEYVYLSNTCLIIAAVGANFIAGSVLAGIEQGGKKAPTIETSGEPLG